VRKPKTAGWVEVAFCVDVAVDVAKLTMVLVPVVAPSAETKKGRKANKQAQIMMRIFVFPSMV
jgi:hypothetical protein